jgi:hypothetical protein
MIAGVWKEIEAGDITFHVLRSGGRFHWRARRGGRVVAGAIGARTFQDAFTSMLAFMATQHAETEPRWQIRRSLGGWVVTNTHREAVYRCATLHEARHLVPHGCVKLEREPNAEATLYEEWA